MIVRGIRAVNFRAIKDQMLQTRSGGFVISGANGSGKSSWIYALRFCFYGRVPDLTLNDLLHWEADEGQVTTWFDVGGEQYFAERVFNTKTSQLSVYQWVDQEWKNIGGPTTTEATQTLMKILRIPEEVFDQIVIKQQGEFGSLTEATPAGRYEIFKRFADVEMWEKYGKKNEEMLKNIEERVLAHKLTIDQAQLSISSLGLKPVDTEVFDKLAREIEELQKIKVSLGSEYNTALAFEKELRDYQLAQKVVQDYRDAQFWAEKWQEFKNITEPKVKFSPEKLHDAEKKLELAQTQAQKLPELIRALEEEIAVFPSKLKALEDEYRTALEELMKITEHNMRLQKDREVLERKKKLVSQGQCPECERPFDNHEQQIKEIDEAIQALTSQLIDISPYKTKCQTLEVEIRQMRDQWKQKQEELSKTRASKDNLANLITQIEKEIQAIKESEVQTELWKQRQAFVQEYPYKDKGSPEAVYQMWLAACAVKDPRIGGPIPKRSSQEIQEHTEKIEKTIRDLSLQIQALKDKDQNYRHHQKRIEEAQAELQKLLPELELHQHLKLVYGKNGAPRKVVDRWIHAVQAEANQQLDKLTGGRFSISFIGKTETGKSTLDLVILDNVKGQARKFKTLSGGERTRINVALALALSNAFSNLSGIEVGTLLFDEVYGLDEQGQYDFAQSIKMIAESKPIVGAISCFESMSAYFDNHLVMCDGVLVEN